MIEFQCSTCQQFLEVEDAGAGMRLACPACAAEIVVPGLTVQDTPESVLKFVREQADRKAALKMYYAAADLVREYMGPLAEATKAEREILALDYEQRGRKAEERRAQPAPPIVSVAEPVRPTQSAQGVREIPERVEPLGKRYGSPSSKNTDQPLRVVPRQFNHKSDDSAQAASIPAAARGGEAPAAFPAIVHTGWRLLCGFVIVALIGLFALDAELRSQIDQAQRINAMTPQNLFAIRLELQNPFSARSAFFKLLESAAGGLLGVVGICAIIALAKDHVKQGMTLLAAAAISFAIVYFAAERVAHNRTQPLIDQANQQLQEFQQSMDGVMQQMQQTIRKLNPPHR